MPMFWRRRSSRHYKMVSSSSSSSSDDDEFIYMSDSSSSSGSWHLPKTNPPLNTMASSSTMVVNRGTKKPCDEASNCSAQSDSDSEVDQNQLDLHEYDTDSSYDDCELQIREYERSINEDHPRLQWEIMSIQYKEWFKKVVRHNTEQVTAEPATFEPSPDVTLALLKYQKEWLAWGLNQEASEAKGGILADEMGMGKTIQAIALVVTARSLYARSEASCSSSKGNNKCTLIICPLVELIQWEKEIERCTANGTVKILVFHGAKKPREGVDFNRYDFVLTTYSTIKSEFRNYVMPPKEICELCGRSFVNVTTLKLHQREFCIPDAKRAAKMKAAQKKKVNTMDPTDISARRDASPIYSTRWERIILDEAHLIKERRSNTAKAVFELESEYKWALTGTPLQNRVEELYSLIHYLQIIPFSYYFCKDCNCRVQNFISNTTHCPNCEHSGSRHFSWWKKYITQPLQDDCYSKQGQRAMLLLREKVLKSVLLRRTKSDRAADFRYPPKYITLRQDSMVEREQEFYQALYIQSRSKFNSYVEDGTLMNNYGNIFHMLTQLRQAVDHPYLVLYCSQPETCGLCGSEADDPVITSCEHVFCKSCWVEYLDIEGMYMCPTCLTSLTLGPKKMPKKTSKVQGFRSSSILNRLNLSNFWTSTKIEALREEIRNMVEDDSSAKGVVFSQFTSFLDLIGYSLNMDGIKWVQIDGRMNIDDRNKAVTTFTDDADYKILLMRLKGGGVALDLVVASYVFLMDPWWNPAAEKQAEDRIHRIRQYKPIRVIRFVIENTVEERILALQGMKELLLVGTIGNSSEVMEKLTAADLQFLFSTY